MRFLVFQHLEVEHPGFFRDLWRARGVEWTTVELDQGASIPSDLSPFSALVAMGGPMDVWQIDEYPWLVPEIAAIRHFVVELGRPFLGVCLGHQLLAHALGGKVAPARIAEVGATPVRLMSTAKQDAVFRGLSSPVMTFQCHGAEVQQAPPGAVVLAETDLCSVQAFRWGSNAYGIQFHAEITGQTPNEWLSIPAYKKYIEAALGPDAAIRLFEETQQLLPLYNGAAKHLNENFLKLIEAG